MFFIQPSQTPPFVNVADAVVADISREAVKEEDVKTVYMCRTNGNERENENRQKKRVALCDAIEERHNGQHHKLKLKPSFYPILLEEASSFRCARELFISCCWSSSSFELIAKKTARKDFALCGRTSDVM